MTRWDCDVKLWRGVPCSFPAFHGWPAPMFDIVLSSTASLRYTCCPSCLRWVPETPWYHDCMKHVVSVPTTTTTTTTRSVAAAITARTKTAELVNIDTCGSTLSNDSESEDGPRSPVYVISTEENYKNNRCNLCQDLFRLQFLHDIEDWVFMDCVEHEGSLVHECCRDIVLG